MKPRYSWPGRLPFSIQRGLLFVITRKIKKFGVAKAAKTACCRQGRPHLQSGEQRFGPERTGAIRLIAARCPSRHCVTHRAAMICDFYDRPMLFKRSITSGVSFNSLLARFCFRCSGDEVPGISKMFGERCSSHASATCNGVALSPLATRLIPTPMQVFLDYVRELNVQYCAP